MTNFKRNVTCLGALLTCVAGCAVEQPAPIEETIADLLTSGRLKGVASGDHATTEVGDMVVDHLLATAKV